MAALTRGISFRRQGSSGLSWTDTWSLNEEGVLVRSMKEEVTMQQQQVRFGGAALSRIHDLHYLNEEEAQLGIAADTIRPSSSSSTALPLATEDCPSSPARLSRSKSVGSVLVASDPLPRPPRRPGKAGLRLLRWLKKAFTKSRPRA